MSIAEHQGTRSEWFWLALFLILPVILAVWVSPYLLPWVDEGQFVDPASNLLFGHGFTSSAWPYQRPDELFIGNAPGYSLLLALWFGIVGFGVFEARALNLVFVMMAAILLFAGLRRALPDGRPWLHAFAVSTSLLGYGIALSYWSARYDALGMLLASALFWVWCQRDSPSNRVLLFLLGAALFLSGFHLVVAAVPVSAILLRVYGRLALRRLLAFGGGIAVGGCGWLALVATQGLFTKFFLITFGSQHTISGQLAQMVLQGDRGFVRHMANAYQIIFQDPSLLITGLAVLVLSMVARAQTPSEKARLAAGRQLALGFIVVVPVVLMLAGKFPLYYSWLAYIPAVLLATVLVPMAPAPMRSDAVWVVVAVFAASFAIGGGRLALTLRGEAANAGYLEFERWARAAIQPKDWVYSDFEGYFAARSVADRVFTGTYGNTRLVPGIPEADNIDVLLIQARNLKEITSRIAGKWSVVGRYDNSVANSKLHYVVMRRSP